MSVAVFENQVFYSDITKLAVMRADKKSTVWPVDVTQIYKVDQGIPTSVAVSHPALQVLTSRGQ